MTLPTKAELLDFIKAMREPVSKRDLATAFRIRGDDRRPFKALLSQLESEGLIARQPSQRYAVPEGLPAVTMIEVTGMDVDGDLFAKPLEWDADLQGPPPRIEIVPDKKGHPAMKEGDRALARLRRTDDANIYEAAIIKRADDAR
ncbi:MAG: ribonuclease R, partial [Pseudobdellovibrionaceae bacterium]